MVPDEKFIPETWRTLAVMPFIGSVAWSRVAAEFFAFQIQRQPHFPVVTPAMIELTLRRKGLNLPPHGIEISDAQNAAQLVAAQAVFVGNIAIRYGQLQEAIAEAKLVDAASGRVIATVAASVSDRQVPCGDPRIENCELDLVTAAIEQVAAKMLVVLNDLSQKMTDGTRR